MSASSDAGSVQPELLVPPAPATPRVDGRAARRWLAWIGVVPFFTFALLFLLLPTGFLMVGAFQDAQGHFTLANFRELFQPTVLDAYWISFKVSAASRARRRAVRLAARVGGGAGQACPAGSGRRLMTFSGVASNFAGVPLAFAFICTLGRVGLVTVLLKKYLGFNLYSTGFSILSFFGLTLTYLYFQIPLMVLIVTPALDGLKREWREACDCLGGTAVSILALCRVAGVVAERARRDAAAVRQCVRRGRHGLRADRQFAEHRARSCCTRRFAATCCTTRISATRSRSAWCSSPACRTAATSGCARAPKGDADEKRNRARARGSR